MLYLTIIGIVCAAVAPVGTLEFGFKDRIKNSVNRQDADHVHIEGRPGNTTEFFDKAESASGISYTNTEVERSGRRKLLENDAFELDLSYDLEESGEVDMTIASPTTKKMWKRKRIAKTNLNDVTADAEIDMNKRIERLARECSQHGEDVEDTLKSPLADEVTESPSVDGLQEVLEIFSGRDEEKRLWLAKREIHMNSMERKLIPRRRRRKRRKHRFYRDEVTTQGTTNSEHVEGTVRMPWHVRGKPLGYMKSHISCKTNFAPKQKSEPEEQFNLDKFEATVKDLFRNSGTSQPTEESSLSTECTTYMGVFERKMKEFREQQKLKNTECSSTTPWQCPSSITFKDLKETTPWPPNNCITSEESTTSVTYELPNSGDLSSDRYLKIRHALRNYLIKTNVLSPKVHNYHWHRKKRCNKSSCFMRKCKKVPPLVCLPYIKKGQDDMIKFIINVLQSMLDKSANSKKPYSLTKLKYKALRGEDSWESIESEIVSSCQSGKTTCCQKGTTSPVYAPPFAILPFQLAYPPCECPISTCPPPLLLPPPFCVTTPSPTYPPTCPPTPTYPPTFPPTFPQTCPPTCPPTTTPLPLPPPTSASTIPCTEPPCSQKQIIRPCLSFDPITQPPLIIPTFFPPWPTTPVDSIADPCRHSVATDRNIGGSCCLETFQPWPTTPRPKSTSCKNCMKNFRYRGGKNHELNFNMADQPPLDRLFDNVDYPYQNMNMQNTFMNPDESKMNRFDFESVYDSPGQETVEEAQIDVRSHIFDYDPSNSFDVPGQPFEASYEMVTQPLDHVKMNVNGGPFFRRRKYPRRLSKRLRKMKEDERNREEHDFHQDYVNDYMSSRQKRDDLEDKRSTEELDAHSSTKSSNALISGRKSSTNTTEASSNSTTDMGALISESSNYRSRYESYSQERNDDKRPTTLKSAAIVRGPKRLSNHPQAKAFPKVFPESYSYNPVESSTVKAEKTTQATGNGNSSLMHLQLLAVCEGYLEMIKLLKINNHTNDDGLDAELIRYCESEISKSFDTSRDSLKAKKSLKTTTLAIEGTPTESIKGQVESPVSKRNLRNKVVVDILGSPIYKEMRAHSLSKNNRYNSGASVGDFRRKRRRRKRRGHRNRLLRKRKKGDNEDSVRLLRKKKGALASWLFDGKDKEAQENEYIDDSEDDEDIAEKTNTETVSSSSTSSSVRRKEISTKLTTSLETVYPIYAKNYGYDKGGELAEIEILWKALNQRNETKDFVKNMTVLAMLMNPEEEERDVQLVEEGDELKSDMKKPGGRPRVKLESNSSAPSKRANGTVSLFAEEDVVNEMVEEDTTTSAETSSDVETTLLGHITTTELATTKDKNNTGNGTYAHAVSTAKELVKDYTIEFLNYAVYIIPIMFILLFFVCCVCFILKIMIHNRKKRKNKNKNNKNSKNMKNRKKKVVVPPSSETESETSESSLLEANKKQKPKKMEALKHKSRKIWSAFKSRNKGESDDEDETDEEKNRSRDKKFLKFLRKEKRQKGDVGDDSDDDNENKYLRKLKRKKNMDSDYYDNEVRSPEKKRVSYKNGSSYGNEREENRVRRNRDAAARERRELIALLEELKHMENEDGRDGSNKDKKEYKSVFVQYMTHEEDKENQTGGFQKFDDGSQKSHGNFEDLRSDNLSIDGTKNLQFDKFSRNIDYRIRDGYEDKFCDRGVGTQPGRKRLLSGDMRRDFTCGDDVLENFRRMSKDMGAELLKGNAQDIAYKFDLLTRMINHLPIGNVSPRKKSILLEELENFRRHVGCRKDIRLKDDGVLCRL